MVHGLLASEAGDGGQHAERIAAEQNEVTGVRPNAGDACIVDVMDRVRGTCVLRHRAAQAEVHQS